MIATLAQAQQQQPLVINTPTIAWRALIPVLILMGGALVILLASAMSRRRALPGVNALATVVTAVAAMIAGIPLWREVTDSNRGPFLAVKGALAIDGFALFFLFVICI